MEVTLDIGKHIFSEIETIAKIEKIGFDVFELKMLDLGLRVYQSSKEDLPSISQESLLEDILKKCLKTNLLLEEAMGHLLIKSDLL